jgi:predicted nucleic acid-binding protein
MKKIYLDVCCLNRPFDDQAQDRIRLEAEAILLILKHFKSGNWQWLRSAIVDYEINKTPSSDRRNRLKQMTMDAHEVISVDDTLIKRGKEIKSMGLKTYDALHVACAEKGQAEVFLSTDDKIKRVGVRYAHRLRVRIENPLTWLSEVTSDE